MFLCFQSVTGPKTRVSVFKQNTLHTCFVKTQVFKFKTLVFCQNTYTCFQSVTIRCFLTCLDSKHPDFQCKKPFLMLMLQDQFYCCFTRNIHFGTDAPKHVWAFFNNYRERKSRESWRIVANFC